MAVMLRAVGVPTRNVNGFLGGEWNEYDNYVAVRAGDAHSWVEVYFYGLGWVTFDPTPAADLDQLGRGGGGILERLGRMADTMRFKWFKWVIEYDLYRQLSLFRQVGQLLRGGTGLFNNRTGGARGWMKQHKREIALFVAAVSVVIAALWVWRRRRQKDVGLNPHAARRRHRDPIAQIYRTIQTRLSKRGHRRDPATTPREHATQLLKSRAPGASELAELTEIYYAAEYGSQTSPELISRAKVLSEQIELALRQKAR
jgi:hypothetical protein